MKISAETIKLIIHRANDVQREINVKEQKLGRVTIFKTLDLQRMAKNLLKNCTSSCSSDTADASYLLDQ